MIERAVDHAIVARLAEACGAMDAVCAMTLDYLRTRSQFGKPIGSFQALQHRAVDLRIQTALTRASIEDAAATLDGLDDGQVAPRQAAVSRAKARAAEAALLVTRAAVPGGLRKHYQQDAALRSANYAQMQQVAQRIVAQGMGRGHASLLEKSRQQRATGGGEVRGTLAQRLLRRVPYLDRAFFCNSGTEAVEAAIAFSSDGNAIVETYCEGPEINVTAVVQSGHVTLLSLSDRVAAEAGVADLRGTTGTMPERRAQTNGLARHLHAQMGASKSQATAPETRSHTPHGPPLKSAQSAKRCPRKDGLASSQITLSLAIGSVS